MSLPYLQQFRLGRMRRTLVTAEPRLASMLVLFTRLYAGEEMPACEQMRRRPPWPVRALARVVWAAIWLGRRALLGCRRVLSPCVRLVGACGGLLRRAALRCLVTWRFLPTGFRLTTGAWLVTHHPAASVPPAAHRRNP